MRIWNYALQFLVFRSEQLCVFASSLQVPLHIMQRAQNFVSLNYLQNLSHFYEVTSTSLLSRGTLLLLYLYNVVTVFNMYRRQ